MSRLRRGLNADGSIWGYSFECPGCKETHAVPVAPSEHAWGFNGNESAPTFTPSYLFHGDQRGALPGFRCHSHVTDGKIAFLNDCTHALAGQTVDLPEVP